MVQSGIHTGARSFLGLPVVTTTASPAGPQSWATSGSASLFLGDAFRIDVSTEAGDRWDKNLTGFRGRAEWAGRGGTQLSWLAQLHPCGTVPRLGLPLRRMVDCGPVRAARSVVRGHAAGAAVILGRANLPSFLWPHAALPSIRLLAAHGRHTRRSTRIAARCQTALSLSRSKDGVRSSTRADTCEHRVAAPVPSLEGQHSNKPTTSIAYKVVGLRPPEWPRVDDWPDSAGPEPRPSSGSHGPVLPRC